MKKVLGIFAIAATLVACDNSASSEQRTKDSLDSIKRVDSMNALNPTPSTPSTDTMTMPMGDTSMKSGMDTMSRTSADSVR